MYSEQIVWSECILLKKNPTDNTNAIITYLVISTDEGSVPEKRIWSIFLIKSDLKWCIHLKRSLFLYSRRSIEIWRVLKIYGRRGAAEPSIYFTNPLYYYRPSGTDQISVLFCRGPCIVYAETKIRKKITTGFIHIRQSFVRENVTLQLPRTTS